MSQEAIRRITNFCWHDCRSDTNCWLHPYPNTDHALKSSFTRTLSATPTVSFSIAAPVSEKKLFCVKKGSRTKSCTQIMTPSTASRLTATRSKMMLNGAPRLFAPLTTSVVNCKTWTKHGNYENELMIRKSKLDITYLVQTTTSPKSRLWGPRRQDVPYIRATPFGDALQLPLILHRRLIFSLTGLHSLATGPTRLHLAIQKMAEQMKRSIVIPPTKILRQKQRSLCLTYDRAATVHSTVLVSSSMNFRASFRNSLRRQCLLSPLHWQSDFPPRTLFPQ